MDFHDYSTTHDLTRKAGLTNEPPAAFYRQLQAAAYVERARGVQGMAVEFNRYQSELSWAHFRLLSAGRVTFVRQATVRPRLHASSAATLPGGRH